VAANFHQAGVRNRPGAAHTRLVAVCNCPEAADKRLGVAMPRWVEADTGSEAKAGLLWVAVFRSPREQLVGARAAEIRRLRRTQHSAGTSRHIVGI
jgi:hypothetical protein